jgi:hypothetical protein
MKISELNDEDVLNFLMTSEFTEGDYSPSEFRYLLTKWRYFHRYFQGRNEQTKMSLEDTIKRLQEELEVAKKGEYDVQVKVADKDNLINSLKSRKLTWKERFSGKIILTEDENKQL